MSTTSKTFLYISNKVSFRLNIIFVRGSSPAQWVGNTECFLCAQVLESKAPSSVARIQSNLKKSIDRHMKSAHS